MHELLLYGQVPAARHEQLLNILAGITAMQPQRVVERHALYKPTRNSAPTLMQRGGTQGVQNAQKLAQNQRVTDLHYTHLVKTVEENDFGEKAEAANSTNIMHDGDSNLENPWVIQFQDTPEPGKRPASLRYASVTEVTQGDVQQYMVNFGYRYLNEYVLEGHRFILNNAILLLHRILQYPDVHTDTSPRSTLPTFSSLIPFDASGAYLIEVKIRLSDGINPALINTGNQEMERLRTMLKGVVDLNVPDRLALDTRVR